MNISLRIIKESEFEQFLAEFQNQKTSPPSEYAKGFHPLDPRAVHSADIKQINYAFQCAICEEIGMDSWYQIVVTTHGGSPMLARSISEEDLRNGNTGSNLAIILKKDLEITSSALHHLQGKGYMCDHCKDSI